MDTGVLVLRCLWPQVFYGRIRQDKMGTKADNRWFTGVRLVNLSATANDFRGKLRTLIREYRPILGVGDELVSEVVDIAKEEELGVVAGSSDTLQDDLPSGVGEKKALAWAVRVHEGELCEDIALGAHTNVGTVQQSVELATDYIGLEVESGDKGTD